MSWTLECATPEYVIEYCTRLHVVIVFCFFSRALYYSVCWSKEFRGVFYYFRYKYLVGFAMEIFNHAKKAWHCRFVQYEQCSMKKNLTTAARCCLTFAPLYCNLRFHLFWNFTVQYMQRTGCPGMLSSFQSWAHATNVVTIKHCFKANKLWPVTLPVNIVSKFHCDSIG